MKTDTRANAQRKKESSQALIGEMMLAKTVLEEKNELLDQKDQRIRELRSRQKQIETELEELKGEVERLDGERTAITAKAEQEGMRRVIAEVVQLASEYEAGSQALDRSLSSRLIRLFRERYKLEVIAGTPERIDPDCHQVIEVLEGTVVEGKSEITVLARGYRLGGKTIKPALVRVIRGNEGDRLPFGSGVPRMEPWRVA